MTLDENKFMYTPGMYTKKRTSASQLAERYIQEWESGRMAEIEKDREAARVYNCICFSRKIGVGALEIADQVSEKMGLKVVDREILEHIANDHQLSESTVNRFDERYPGARKNFTSMMFGEKSYTMDDYMRHLVGAVYTIADSGPTIFVGRATHLILPRERVLAVRFISSKAHRVRRVAAIMNVSENEAEKQLVEEDRKQADFFKKNFKIKDATPYEFDLVINRDYIPEAHWAAELVETAYRLKFNE